MLQSSAGAPPRRAPGGEAWESAVGRRSRPSRPKHTAGFVPRWVRSGRPRAGGSSLKEKRPDRAAALQIVIYSGSADRPLFGALLARDAPPAPVPPPRV